MLLRRQVVAESNTVRWRASRCGGDVTATSSAFVDSQFSAVSVISKYSRETSLSDSREQLTNTALNGSMV